MPRVGELGEPPAEWNTAPIVLTVSAGTVFIRLHDPIYSTRNPYPVLDPAERRSVGPFARFDPHAADDSGRGVVYGAERLTGAVAEVYGQTRTIDRLESMQVGFFAPRRDLELIDLRGQGALAVGATAELMTTPDRDLSQRWARWLYERYRRAAGVAYTGRYAGCLCVALWERAPLERSHPSLPLIVPWIFRQVEIWADRHGFIVDR